MFTPSPSLPHPHISLPYLLSQFRQHFRPQPANEFNTPHHQVPAAVDTGLGNLLLQLPHHLRNIHQHTPAAQHNKVRPVTQCHNRLIRILTAQPVMHLTAGLTRRWELNFCKQFITINYIEKLINL